MVTTINNIRSAADILGASNNRRAQIGKQATELREALSNITNEAKYTTRAKLDASGTSKVYDNAQARMVQLEINKTTIQITGGKLDSQFEALTDIEKAMTEFEQERAQTANAAGTNAQKADRALVKIQNILRSKNPSGEYTFGGSDQFTDPLSRIDIAGNRVSVNLTQTSNVITDANNKLFFINNYSDANSDNTVITASSSHEVKESFVYPGMDAMMKTIGYLNAIKEGRASDNDLEVARLGQLNARSEVKLSIDIERKKIEAARDTNLEEFKTVSQTLDEFKADIPQLTAKAGDLIRSLFASISVSNASDQAFNTLLERTSI